jgi:anti-sigma factor RsiW
MKPQSLTCTTVRGDFSSYLDGAVSGVQMAAIGDHLQLCPDCNAEFQALVEMQEALAALGPAQPPVRLQARLRSAIAEERSRGTHLPLPQRALLLWERSVAPIALRVAGGLSVAMILVAGMGYLFAAPIAVQADDDRIANFVSPHYLYSEVPPQPLETQRETPIYAPVVVEALVDTNGRVYDYAILEGPRDANVKAHVEQNLLASVYKPATVLGTPVRGHVVLTYTDVSVHG